ncbi:hypothetical protein GGR50DRAFT_705393 [Xylaria sp. CBS 124048]|nr:hypothetical protein GGR50DRAFT_705393 [Xylaria sp. CBS 124048]
MSSDSDEISGLFIGVNIALFVLAVVSVSLRCYVRLGITRSFGPDDYWMLATLASFTANTTIALLGAKHGLGRHIWNLSPRDLRLALKFTYATEITYGLTMILAKISIALYLLRLTPIRLQRHIIYLVTGLTCVAGLTLTFIVAFQCKPPSRAWNMDAPGSCISTKAIRIATYTYSALAIVTDFTFTLLPLFLIWHLHMDKRTKVALVPVFSLALLASLAVVIRIPLIKDFTETDFLFATARFGLWSATEQGLAIMAGSLITLRPLARKLVEVLRLTISASSQPLSGPRESSKVISADSRGIDGRYGGGGGAWNRLDGGPSDAISLRGLNSTATRSNADVEEENEALRQSDACVYHWAK